MQIHVQRIARAKAVVSLAIASVTGASTALTAQMVCISRSCCQQANLTLCASCHVYPSVSCPGSYCHYDPITHEQLCSHCCHASYEHTDGEVYLPNERKVPCDANHAGSSQGICDGFGKCQCAPPFITTDCSVRKCRVHAVHASYGAHNEL